jgi:propanediol utilization protein
MASLGGWIEREEAKWVGVAPVTGEEGYMGKVTVISPVSQRSKSSLPCADARALAISSPLMMTTILLTAARD